MYDAPRSSSEKRHFRGGQALPRRIVQAAQAEQHQAELEHAGGLQREAKLRGARRRSGV